jgi:hypothetical protein
MFLCVYMYTYIYMYIYIFIYRYTFTMKGGFEGVGIKNQGLRRIVCTLSHKHTHIACLSIKLYCVHTYKLKYDDDKYLPYGIDAHISSHKIIH